MIPPASIAVAMLFGAFGLGIKRPLVAEVTAAALDLMIDRRIVPSRDHDPYEVRSTVALLAFSVPPSALTRAVFLFALRFKPIEAVFLLAAPARQLDDNPCRKAYALIQRLIVLSLHESAL
ncbi:MAG: hypothetical protein U0787_09945 [Polyangia bacterium]